MPEFILNHGSPFAAKQFGELDEFTQGYIEAMFFTNTGSGDDEELEHATVADLAPETLATIVGDCEAFQLQAAACSPQSCTDALNCSTRSVFASCSACPLSRQLLTSLSTNSSCVWR